METQLDSYINYKIEPGPITVIKTQVLKGANYFSGGPLILFRIDLGLYNEIFTNQIINFYLKLSEVMPSLHEHHCSIGRPGGFFHRVKEGTLLGHVMEHVAIELQTLAGMDVGFGKTRSTLQDGVYNVVFRFFDEIAGMYAGKAALNLINSILQEKSFNVNSIVDNLIDIREQRLFGPSTQAIVDEATKRKIPWLRMDQYNLVQLGTGKYQKKIRATITSDTKLISVETADNKYLSTKMLEEGGVPVLNTYKAKDLEGILHFYNLNKSPITLKPIEGNLGLGVSNNLKNEDEIKSVVSTINFTENDIIVQPYITGKSYRLLIIDYKLVAAVQINPPKVVGDGVHTIAQLIDLENFNPQRASGDKGVLSKIIINQTTNHILASQGLNLNSIPAIGKEIYLQYSGNLKLGGECFDVTDTIHPMNRFLAERAARIIDLNVAGVDIISEDISKSMLENNGIILEVNAAPDFRMHLNPTYGIKRNVALTLINFMFPLKSISHVPIFSITGTVGKTIAVRLLNYCLKIAGYNTGITCTDGLFISDKCLKSEDATSPEFTSIVLKDPTIDCAIFETSKEGILRHGLGYTAADYGIMLNMHNDHVGTDDIKYIEDLAYAKSVVVEELYEDGCAILNADLDMVYDMKSRVKARLALFSKVATNKHVIAHTLKGGLAVTISENAIFVHHKTQSTRLIYLQEVPLTFNNTASLTYDSILAIVAALVAASIPIDIIRKGLQTFKPDEIQLPGRLNYIKISEQFFLIDNAHNEVGFNGVKDFLLNDNRNKIGVIDAAGDRNDDEIKTLGRIASTTYNHLILYEGIDNRGRNSFEIVNLLEQGAIESGFNAAEIDKFDNMNDAIEKTLSYANKENLIVILTADFQKSISLIREKYNTIQ